MLQDACNSRGLGFGKFKVLKGNLICKIKNIRYMGICLLIFMINVERIRIDWEEKKL